MSVKSIIDASSVLNKMFDSLNKECFNGGLPKAQVVCEKVRGAYGAFWIVEQYRISQDDNHEWAYKIAINPAEFDRPIENVCATLVHEMVHLYCKLNNINDTSRGGYYHNKEFKSIAEATKFVTISKLGNYGFSKTDPTEELIKFCKVRHWSDFEILECARSSVAPVTDDDSDSSDSSDSDSGDSGVKVKTSRKHTCPVCGAIARTTKDIPLICGKCKEPMLQE